MTADEILEQMANNPELYAADPEEICVIDNDLRTISIPSSVQLAGVESDEDVRRLYFQMPKQYGEVDLSEFDIRINFMNANNQGDVYAVTDKQVTGDNITFSWLVGRNALAYRGNIRFVVCLKKVDAEGAVQQEFNTTVAQLAVLEGLETTEAVVAENPDIIEQILARLDDLEENGGGGEGGTSDYNALANKPKLNGVEIVGNKTSVDYKIVSSEQGAENNGKFLGVGADGNVTPVDKPTYTADEVGARPNTWTPSAEDVGALPNDTEIPSKTSDLENDSGFVTNSDIPEKLPNPQKIIFTGAVSAEYDGSSQQTINIPSGGGTESNKIKENYYINIGGLDVSDNTAIFLLYSGIPIEGDSCEVTLSSSSDETIIYLFDYYSIDNCVCLEKAQGSSATFNLSQYGSNKQFVIGLGGGGVKYWFRENDYGYVLYEYKQSSVDVEEKVSFNNTLLPTTFDASIVVYSDVDFEEIYSELSQVKSDIANIKNKTSDVLVNLGVKNICFEELSIAFIGDSIMEGYGTSDYNGGDHGTSGHLIENNVKTWYRNTGSKCWTNMMINYILEKYNRHNNIKACNNAIGGFTCQNVY